MANQANITSVEALEAFRAQLVVYLAHMRPVLEEISTEVQRTRSWVEDDRHRHWLQQQRRCLRKLDDARQELFTATMSRLGDAAGAQQLAVQRAQRELRAVEDKLAAVKKWQRELDHQSAPLVKQMEQLHGFLTVEMERAVAYLDLAIRALDAYRDVGPRTGAGGTTQ